ncbi:MAG: 4-phosphopantoate--beta-alanine ligase, partial [Succinivibrionaceae bacterium]|nr:4-phosphopantoate--beta-alanine ligase [Succinivibrionaceae bacterium]
MIIARDIETVRKTVRQYHDKNESIAIVTTMGNLHTGHITLVKEAEKLADHTVATVFVNPLQFNNKNDLKTYPRTPEADLKKLEDAGVDMVFMPTPEIMYPEGMDVQTTVNVPHLSEILEGAMRPGHFRGVATVVLKLFNIVTPDYCMFGQKDYQQV